MCSKRVKQSTSLPLIWTFSCYACIPSTSPWSCNEYWISSKELAESELEAGLGINLVLIWRDLVVLTFPPRLQKTRIAVTQKDLRKCQGLQLVVQLLYHLLLRTAIKMKLAKQFGLNAPEDNLLFPDSFIRVQINSLTRYNERRCHTGF